MIRIGKAVSLPEWTVAHTRICRGTSGHPMECHTVPWDCGMVREWEKIKLPCQCSNLQPVIVECAHEPFNRLDLIG